MNDMQEKRMNQSLLKRQPLLELCELFVCGLALTVSLSVPLRFARETRHDCDWSVMTYHDLRLPKTCIKLLLVAIAVPGGQRRLLFTAPEDTTFFNEIWRSQRCA